MVYLFFRFLVYLTFIFSAEVEAAETCSADDMREGKRFLVDYLTCMSGSSEACDVLNGTLEYTIGDTASSVGQTYLYNEIRKYGATKLGVKASLDFVDPKKRARDSVYISEINKKWGDQAVDDFIESQLGKGKNIDVKLADLEKVRQNVEWDIERNIKTGDLMGAEKLTQKLESINFRIDAVQSNQGTVKQAIDVLRKHNDRVDERIVEIDRKLEKGFSRKLRSERRALAKSYLTMESADKSFVEAYNGYIDGRVKEGKTPLSKIDITKTSSTRVSRLAWEVREGKLRAENLARKSSQLPPWAREYRLSAVREFPGIVSDVYSQNPQLTKSLQTEGARAELKELLSEAEHERWRKWRRQGLVTTYEELRKMAPDLYDDKKYQLNVKGEIKSGAVFTREQNEALNMIKNDWIKGDTPWREVADIYKGKTYTQIQAELERFPVWDSLDNKYGEVLRKFALKKPWLAGKLGAFTRLGPGLALNVGMVWFDRVPLRELAYQAGMSTAAKNLIWPRIAPSCRMPESAHLKSEVKVGTYAPYFCGCDDEKKKAKDLDELCLDAQGEDEEICRTIRETGRNKPLLAASDLKKLKAKTGSKAQSGDEKRRELLKKEPGCAVLKNYKEHCNYTTDGLTDQGLFFLSVIEEEKLYDEIPELCPDVCSHWQEVVGRKMREWKSLHEKLNLPKTKEENSKSNIFECLPNGKVNVRLKHLGLARPQERYEIEYDPDNRIPKVVRLKKTSPEPVEGIDSQQFVLRERNAFYYVYDEEGDLSRVEIVGQMGRSNEVKTLEVSQILPEYGEAAYNATSDIIAESEIARRTTGLHVPKLMFSWEEQVIGRRLEVSMITKQAIKFCVDGGGDASKENKKHLQTK